MFVDGHTITSRSEGRSAIRPIERQVSGGVASTAGQPARRGQRTGLVLGQGRKRDERRIGVVSAAPVRDVGDPPRGVQAVGSGSRGGVRRCSGSGGGAGIHRNEQESGGQRIERKRCGGQSLRRRADRADDDARSIDGGIRGSGGRGRSIGRKRTRDGGIGCRQTVLGSQLEKTATTQPSGRRTVSDLFADRRQGTIEVAVSVPGRAAGTSELRLLEAGSDIRRRQKVA